MKFCYKCGKQLDEGSSFCPYCGSEQPAEEYGRNENPRNEYTGNENPRNEYGGNGNGRNEYGGNQYRENQYSRNEYGGNEYGRNENGGNGYDGMYEDYRKPPRNNKKLIGILAGVAAAACVVVILFVFVFGKKDDPTLTGDNADSMQKPSVTVSEDVTPGAKSGGLGDAAVKKAEEAGKDSEEASAKETAQIPTAEPTEEAGKAAGEASAKETDNVPTTAPPAAPTTAPTREPVKVPTVTITAEPTPEESAEPTKKPEKEAAEESAESTKKPEKEEAEESAKPTKKSEKEEAEESAKEKTTESAKELTKSPTPQPTPEPDNKVYMYCTANDYLTLRDIPSRSGNSLARISYNEKVEYLGSEGEFTHVSYNGQNGYVLTEFLAPVPDANKNYSDGKKSESGSQNQNADSTIYCRASEYVTLRGSNSTSSADLGKVPSGAAVSFISSVGDWYYVEYNGTQGYVLAKFFSSNPNAPLVYDQR